MASRNLGPLVAIVGQTASGKTSFAIELAEYIGGEIICADSRTVYKNMDIGTAKPSLVEQKRVKHHLIDVVNPDENFSVSDFKQLAEAAMLDIQARKKIPILVGGSGLYIDSIIYDYKFRENVNSPEETSGMTIEQMKDRILGLGLELPENHSNPRYLSRIIQTKQNSPSNRTLRENTIVVGLDIPAEILLANSINRTNIMIKNGLIDELRQLVDKYDFELNSFRAPSYKGLIGYINGDNDLQKSIQEIVNADLRLAKKQRTWFKRNKSIHWLNNPSEYVATTTTLLNKLISSKN